jgi:hypothetical protein
MDAASPLPSSPVRTAVPSRHLQRLCKHVQRKLPVIRDGGRGRIAFPRAIAAWRPVKGC